MTPGQRRWLEKLRDHGPQRRPRYGAYPCAMCARLDWSRMYWADDLTHEEISPNTVVERKFKRVHVMDCITDAGRAALIGEGSE